MFLRVNSRYLFANSRPVHRLGPRAASSSISVRDGNFTRVSIETYTIPVKVPPSSHGSTEIAKVSTMLHRCGAELDFRAGLYIITSRCRYGFGARAETIRAQRMPEAATGGESIQLSWSFQFQVFSFQGSPIISPAAGIVRFSPGRSLTSEVFACFVLRVPEMAGGSAREFGGLLAAGSRAFAGMG